MAAPSMKERQACWGARDEYWKCLDENPEDASQCKKLRSSFESSCPQQWVFFSLKINQIHETVIQGCREPAHIKAPGWTLGARAVRRAPRRRSHGPGGSRGGKARKDRHVPEPNARLHNTHQTHAGSPLRRGVAGGEQG
nr:uncharacterized protein LOC131751181 isoform X2 [Kogia breviceps]